MKTTETIAARTDKGNYDFGRETRLVRADNGNHYLLMDCWCGQDLHGECYRAFVWEIPASQVSDVKFAITNSDEPITQNDPTCYITWGDWMGTKTGEWIGGWRQDRRKAYAKL